MILLYQTNWPSLPPCLLFVPGKNKKQRGRWKPEGRGGLSGAGRVWGTEQGEWGGSRRDKASRHTRSTAQSTERADAQALSLVCIFLIQKVLLFLQSPCLKLHSLFCFGFWRPPLHVAQGGLKLNMSSSKMRAISNQGKCYLAWKPNDKGCFQGADGRGQRLLVLGQKPPLESRWQEHTHLSQFPRLWLSSFS